MCADSLGNKGREREDRVNTARKTDVTSPVPTGRVEAKRRCMYMYIFYVLTEE